VYVDMLARIKRQACICVCLHILKLGAHLHIWRAGHLHVILGGNLALYSHVHQQTCSSRALAAGERAMITNY